MPTHFTLFAPGTAIIIRSLGAGRWDIRESRHDLGIPVEPLVYNPSLERPFGRSRITRAVMALTDSAVRTLLRSEVSAEFYSAPQRYALGIDEFVDKDGNAVPGWVTMLGRMLAISRDEDGNVPEVGQFPQQTMQPHFEQLRALASMFSAETNLPLDSLGIVHDNPSSADAIMRAKEELVIDARQAIRTFSPAWERQVRRALVMVDSSPSAVAQYAKIRGKWGNPATPTQVSMADAATKEISVFPWMAESPVALEMFGHEQDEIDRLLADKRRAEARQLASSVTRPAAGDAEAV